MRPLPNSAESPARVGQPAPGAPATAAVDAGLGDELLVSVPAFFDGTTAPSDVHTPSLPLNAEDLPTVDPELSSLQDAILAAARAHRSALGRKRDKKAPAAPSPTVSALPRPIDEAPP
jgi:hypothetical protein